MIHCPNIGKDHDVYLIRISSTTMQCLHEYCDRKTFLSPIKSTDKAYAFWNKPVVNNMGSTPPAELEGDRITWDLLVDRGARLAWTTTTTETNA